MCGERLGFTPLSKYQGGGVIECVWAKGVDVDFYLFLGARIVGLTHDCIAYWSARLLTLIVT